MTTTTVLEHIQLLRDFQIPSRSVRLQSRVFGGGRRRGAAAAVTCMPDNFSPSTAPPPPPPPAGRAMMIRPPPNASLADRRLHAAAFAQLRHLTAIVQYCMRLAGTDRRTRHMHACRLMLFSVRRRRDYAVARLDWLYANFTRIQ